MSTHRHSAAGTSVNTSSDVKSSTSNGKIPLPWSDSTILQIAATLVCGSVFGFALHKADVYRASVIRDQMRFHNWTMLKVFLTAASVSTILITAMYTVKSTHKQVKLIGDVVYCVDIGAVSTMLGGFLLGVGMAVSGSCPGTVWAQFGAGSFSSIGTMIGGILGAAVFGMLHQRVFVPLNTLAPVSKKSVGELLGMGRIGGALFLAGLFISVVVAVEASIPFTGGRTFNFTDAVWHPVVAGILIGSLQVPLLVYVGKNLGSSSSFVTLASCCFGTACEDYGYLKKFRDGFINWWQVLYVSAAALGSFLAYATSKGDVLYSVNADGLTMTQSVLGGFLLVFGARIANGCTSGHGMSGLGHQSLRSLIAVASMFGGGILTTLLFF